MNVFSLRMVHPMLVRLVEADMESRKEPKFDEPLRMTARPMHAVDKPIDEMLAEDMAYYEVPFA